MATDILLYILLYEISKFLMQSFTNPIFHDNLEEIWILDFEEALWPIIFVKRNDPNSDYGLCNTCEIQTDGHTGGEVSVLVF